MVALVTTYLVGSALKTELEGVAKPGFVFLMLFTTSGQFFSPDPVHRLFRAAHRPGHGL